MTTDPYSSLSVWSVLLTPADPVLTLPQAKLRAGLDWPDGDPRDDLMTEFVLAATSQVERDTGLALGMQSRLIYILGALPSVVVLPVYSRPLQSVTTITFVDPAGLSATVNPALYTIDQARGLIQLVAGAAWPDADITQPWQIEIVAGYAAPGNLPALLYQAIGLLTAHYATVGRDLTITGTIVAQTPYGYDDLIATYRPVVA
jgi:uncharacterized phiE125 gp8 family phage protein